MPLSVKVSGAWKTVSQVSVKVGGAWKTAIPYVKVGGVWKIAGAQPITVDSDWGLSSGGSPRASASRVLTVPAGNPGSVRFNIVSNDATLEYNYNGGGYTTVTDEGTLSVVDTSTLRFRLTGGSGDVAVLEVYDNTTGDLVGTWTGLIS